MKGYMSNLIKKMKVLKDTQFNCIRWHMSRDVFHTLKEESYIVTMKEDHETVHTCMGLPVTIVDGLEDYVSIE